MLGSIARKLRIFGYDTLYFEEDDSTIERVAKSQGRVILTSDKGLAAHADRRGIAVINVKGRTDKARLAVVFRRARIEANPSASRCAVCNGVLERSGREEARSAGLPERVVELHRFFCRCTSCSKFYWKGKHWDRLRRLSAGLRQRDASRAVPN